MPHALWVKFLCRGATRLLHSLRIALVVRVAPPGCLGPEIAELWSSWVRWELSQAARTGRAPVPLLCSSTPTRLRYRRRAPLPGR